MVLNLLPLWRCSWHSHMAWLASYKSMTLTLKWALVLLGGPTIVTSLVHLVFHTLDYFTEFFPIPSALSLLPPSCSTGKGKQLEEDIASPLWPEFALDHAASLPLSGARPPLTDWISLPPLPKRKQCSSTSVLWFIDHHIFFLPLYWLIPISIDFCYFSYFKWKKKNLDSLFLRVTPFISSLCWKIP